MNGTVIRADNHTDHVSVTYCGAIAYGLESTNQRNQAAACAALINRLTVAETVVPLQELHQVGFTIGYACLRKYVVIMILPDWSTPIAIHISAAQ